MKKIFVLFVLCALILSCKKDKCRDCRPMFYFFHNDSVYYGPFTYTCHPDQLTSRIDSMPVGGVKRGFINQWDCPN